MIEGGARAYANATLIVARTVAGVGGSATVMKADRLVAARKLLASGRNYREIATGDPRPVYNALPASIQETINAAGEG